MSCTVKPFKNAAPVGLVGWHTGGYASQKLNSRSLSLAVATKASEYALLTDTQICTHTRGMSKRRARSVWRQ